MQYNIYSYMYFYKEAVTSNDTFNTVHTKCEKILAHWSNSGEISILTPTSHTGLSGNQTKGGCAQMTINGQGIVQKCHNHI